MSAPRTGRQRALVLLWLGMTLAATGAGASPQAPAPAASCAGPLSAFDLPGSVSGALELACRQVRVASATTVTSAGKLTITRSLLLFENATSLTVAGSGELSVFDSRVRRANNVTDPAKAFRIVAEPDSWVSINGSTLSGGHSVEARTVRRFMVSNTTFTGFEGSALVFNGSYATLSRVAVEESLGGASLRAGAVVAADNVSFRQLAASGWDVASSTLALSDSSWSATLTPLRIVGASRVHLNRLDLSGGGQSKANLGPGGPRLDVDDPLPAWSGTEVVLDDPSGMATIGGVLRIRVLDNATEQPVAGAEVEVRRRSDQEPALRRLTDSAGRTAPFRAVRYAVFADPDDPDQTLLAELHDPILYVRKLHNVTSDTLRLEDLAPGHVQDVRLPMTPDTQPPSRPPGPAAPAWTGSGLAELDWSPGATDPGEHNAIHGYWIYRYPSSGAAPSRLFSFGTRASVPLGEAGRVGFRVQAIDLANNTGEPTPFVYVQNDPVAPWINVTRTGVAGPDPIWFRSASAGFAADARDNLSGIFSFRAVGPTTADCGSVTSSDRITMGFTSEGLHRVLLRACDRALRNATVPVLVGLDRTPPEELGYRLEPPLPNGANGWYAKPVRVEVAAKDSLSGIALTRLRLSPNAAWADFRNNTTVSQAGAHVLVLNATDRAGNFRLVQQRLWVDPTPPNVSVAVRGDRGENGWYRSVVQVNLTAADAASGLAEVGYVGPLDPRTRTVGEIRFDQERNSTIRFYAFDQAGNEGLSPVQDLRIDLERPVAPAISTSPPSGPDGAYRLAWAGSPALDAMSGIARLEVHRSTDGIRFDRVGTAAPTASSTLVAIAAQARNEFFVRAIDRAGWASDSNHVVIRAAGSGGALAAPDAGPVLVRDRHRFTIAPPDPANVTGVSFYVDDRLIRSMAEGPFALDVAADEFPEGEHQVRIVVSRSDGSTWEEVRRFQNRVGYDAFLDERAPYLVSLSGLGLAGLGLGSFGVYRIRRGRF